MILFYWSTKNASFSFEFDINKSENISSDIYKEASKSRQLWIEKGLKEGFKERFKRKIESIDSINSITKEKTNYYQTKTK